MAERAASFATKSGASVSAAVPLLQRKCACGAHSHGQPECAECAKKHGGLQRKLAVGASNDPLEAEADRVADQVMASSMAPGTGVAGPRIQRFSGGGDVSAMAVPDSVDEVLSGPGEPMQAELRSDMESRFGHDFSAVRLHTGESAARSARDVSASAYTAGHHVVLGPGVPSFGASSGRRLLAHELTHVVQQTSPTPLPAGGGEAQTTSSPGHDAKQVQRFVNCEQPSLSLDPCPPREKGEIDASNSDPMTVHDYAQLSDDGSTVNGFAVVGFAIDSGVVKRNLHDTAKWKSLVNFIAKSNVQWNLHGLSDCSGKQGKNLSLRKARAQALYVALPPEARKNVVSVDAAPITDCITGNRRKLDRTLNRAVVIEQSGRSVDIHSSEEKPVEGTAPKFVCGPDVTAQVGQAVGRARSLFAGWTKDQREDACDALIALRVGYCSWDIRELHNDMWISKDYQPKHCATTGAPKGQECGESVEVNGECYYAGTPNYVIYGTMFNLCALEDPDAHFAFSRSNMKTLVDLYKGTGVSGLATPSANFNATLAWAFAGYDGWPSGGSTPPGDRSNCKPMCPSQYTGKSFDIHWYPHHITEGCSPSLNKAVRKGAKS
ncbi:uncharacterized protein DUF4157 [Luteibacter sp. OK325]|uniref:eCIS core domain-containing protein n=1 Tax=Luteibacter sp. OK325 TaxID=2135670 RepID=UPI000D3D90ED|nr:DUF4157 domain-containing protein [Luteibacter sp. OK325]PTR34029.1 uncharacterized protein DUF4157 [Luteibacter sp. OK325]